MPSNQCHLFNHKLLWFEHRNIWWSLWLAICNGVITMLHSRSGRFIPWNYCLKLRYSIMNHCNLDFGPCYNKPDNIIWGFTNSIEGRNMVHNLGCISLPHAHPLFAWQSNMKWEQVANGVPCIHIHFCGTQQYTLERHYFRMLD